MLDEDLNLDIDYMTEDEVIALLDRLIEVSDDIPVMTNDGITYSDPGKFLRSIKTDLTKGPPVVRELAVCHLSKFTRCLKMARACGLHGAWERLAPEVDTGSS